ncbi:MAG: hypothetical protein R2697_03535 [Ilumatobacteraceae bacterium]
MTNLAVNVYADGMNVERIVPIGHDTTHVVYDYFATDLDRIEAMVEMSNVVLDEGPGDVRSRSGNLDAGIYRVGRPVRATRRRSAGPAGRVATAVAARRRPRHDRAAPAPRSTWRSTPTAPSGNASA